MKKSNHKMNRLFILVLMTSLIIFITSCNKGKLIEEYYFTEEMHEQIPFKGSETLNFTNTDSNNIVLSGDNRISEIHQVTECISCNDYYYFETDYIKFSNDIYKLSLSMEASPDSRFTIQYSIGETAFTCDFWNNLPLSNENLHGVEVFIDSIIINNRNYYNIFGDTLIHSGTLPITPYPVFCYYSTEYGVLKINFSDNSSWDLTDIEW